MWLLNAIKELDMLADQPCSCTKDQLSGEDPSVCRSCLAGQMIQELIEIVEGFQKELGF